MKIVDLGTYIDTCNLNDSKTRYLVCYEGNEGRCLEVREGETIINIFQYPWGETVFEV